MPHNIKQVCHSRVTVHTRCHRSLHNSSATAWRLCCRLRRLETWGLSLFPRTVTARQAKRGDRTEGRAAAEVAAATATLVISVITCAQLSHSSPLGMSPLGMATLLRGTYFTVIKWSVYIVKLALYSEARYKFYNAQSVHWKPWYFAGFKTPFISKLVSLLWLWVNEDLLYTTIETMSQEQRRQVTWPLLLYLIQYKLFSRVVIETSVLCKLDFYMRHTCIIYNNVC